MLLMLLLINIFLLLREVMIDEVSVIRPLVFVEVVVVVNIGVVVFIDEEIIVCEWLPRRPIGDMVGVLLGA